MEEARSASFLDGTLGGRAGRPQAVGREHGRGRAGGAQGARGACAPRVEKAGATLDGADRQLGLHRALDRRRAVRPGVRRACSRSAIILLFLRDLRATLISAVAIPTSVIATFAFMDWLGFTFNNMTMLALSLSIGILIDDAIVVIENIHRHLEMGEPPMEAASDGTARDRPGGARDHLVDPRGVRAGRVHEGHRRPLLLPVRPHGQRRGAVSMLVSFTLTPMLQLALPARRARHSRAPICRAASSACWRAIDQRYGAIVRLGAAPPRAHRGARGRARSSARSCMVTR